MKEATLFLWFTLILVNLASGGGGESSETGPSQPIVIEDLPGSNLVEVPVTIFSDNVL